MNAKEFVEFAIKEQGATPDFLYEKDLLLPLEEILREYNSLKLLEFYNICNGLFFGDCMWNFWDIDRILCERQFYTGEALAFCDVMLESIVFYVQNNRIISDFHENEIIAEDISLFYDKIKSQPDNPLLDL